ncbi:MAG: NRDE family protein [Pseudomonadota bacterium]
MCLLLIAHRAHKDYALVVAANRDEFHERPTAPARRWDEHPQLLAGRDLESGGTWLGVDSSGRFSTVTNVRSGLSVSSRQRSRGLLITDFLTGALPASQYATSLVQNASSYQGFNILVRDRNDLYWYSNQLDSPQALSAGIYTLSNAMLDTPWAKTELLRERYARAVSGDEPPDVASLLTILRDAKVARDDDLPDTGVGVQMERRLSPIFIEGTGYGTRCSTVVLIRNDGTLTFHERRYDCYANVSGEDQFSFKLSSDTCA